MKQRKTTDISSAGLAPTGGKGKRQRAANSGSRLTSRLPGGRARLREGGGFPRPPPPHRPAPTRSSSAGERRRRGAAGLRDGGGLTLRTYLVLDLQRGLQGHGLVETLPPAGREGKREVAVQGVREARHPRQQRWAQSGQEQHREGQPDLFAHPCRATSGWKRRGRRGLSARRLRWPPRTPRGRQGRETWSLRKLQVAAAAAANTPTEEHSPTSEGWGLRAGPAVPFRTLLGPGSLTAGVSTARLARPQPQVPIASCTPMGALGG